MCGFVNCKGRHLCILANVSPCPDYLYSDNDNEPLRSKRRRISRSGPGFVDANELFRQVNQELTAAIAAE